MGYFCPSTIDTIVYYKYTIHIDLFLLVWFNGTHLTFPFGYVLCIKYYTFFLNGWIHNMNKKREGIRDNCTFFTKDTFNLKNRNLSKLINPMPRTRFELVTRGFSVLCSTNWAIPAKDHPRFTNGGTRIFSPPQKSYVHHYWGIIYWSIILVFLMVKRGFRVLCN